MCAEVVGLTILTVKCFEICTLYFLFLFFRLIDEKKINSTFREQKNLWTKKHDYFIYYIAFRPRV